MPNTLFEKCAISSVGETAYVRGSGKSETGLRMEVSLKAIGDDFITNFGPLGGASCIAELQNALGAIVAGIANHVLILIGRNGYSGARIGSRVQQLPAFRTVVEFEMPLGQIAPAQLYAQMARRYMETFGTKSEHFGKIAVNIREHATMNDNALMTEH